MEHACIIRSLDSQDPAVSSREVPANQAISIEPVRGTVVRAVRGTLWITQDGNRQDYILVPGAEYHSPDDRKIVVSALGGGGAVTISRANPGAASGFHGSRLRIDSAVVARIAREARGAPARLAGEWIAKMSGNAVKRLRALFTPGGDPALRHVLHAGRRQAFRHK